MQESRSAMRRQVGQASIIASLVPSLETLSFHFFITPPLNLISGSEPEACMVQNVLKKHADLTFLGSDVSDAERLCVVGPSPAEHSIPSVSMNIQATKLMYVPPCCPA